MIFGSHLRLARWTVLRTGIRLFAPGVIVVLLAATPATAAGTVTVMWDANTEPDLAGYILSFGNQSGTYTTHVNVGNQTSWPFSVPDNGRAYYFAVRAYNAASVLSPYSGEVAIRPPQLNQPATQSGGAGAVVFLQLQAADADGDALTYGATGLPGGLAVNPTSGVIAGVLPNAAGNYLVTVSASDGLMTVVQTFTWTITLAVVGSRDLIFDFGPGGIWMNRWGLGWTQIHALSPESLVTGDLDGNGTDEVVIDFGDPYGVWVWLNNSSWEQLHEASPNHMTTGDLDNNGLDDIILDFAEAGIWIRYNNATWTRLHTLNSVRFVVGNIDGTDGDDLIIEFAGEGIWSFRNNSTWGQIHPFNAQQIGIGDIDGTGQDDVIIAFQGANGTWSYHNNTSWSLVHAAGVTQIAAGDMDGNGRDELALGFPDAGVWMLVNGSAWWQLHPVNAEDVLLTDLDGNGFAEVVVDFGESSGVWIVFNSAIWVQMHTLSPEVLASGNVAQ
jgi:hypothetical protein